MKTEVQPRDDEGQKKHYAAEGDNELLLLLFLLRVKPLLEQFRITRHQDEPRDDHRDEQDAEEQPRVPVSKAPGGQEQQKSDKNQSDRDLGDRL